MFETLVPHISIDHAIVLKPGFDQLYGHIYTLSDSQLRSLKANVETKPANGFIKWASSTAAAQILSSRMNNGGRLLCVDFRALNCDTIKTLYPLQVNSAMLNRLLVAQIITELYLWSANDLI